MMNYVLSSMLGVLFLFGTNKLHNYHVTHTQVEHKATLEELQITQHIFIDDLTTALRKEGFKKMRLGTKREHANADSLIFAYITAHLQLKVDGQPVEVQYVGKEQSDDLHAFWVYLLVEEVSPFETLKVRNSLFTSIFNDQQNITEFTTSQGETKQFLFNKAYLEDEFLVE